MKVGIIGAGAAGLTTAWLLDQECETVLFEQSNRLGGHAHTIFVKHNGEDMPVEIGFEFFNTWLFPKFIRLLTVLKVPVASFSLTDCFHTKENRVILSSLNQFKVIKQFFNPSFLLLLLQFNYVLVRGKQFIEKRDYALTIEQFADKFFLTHAFKNDFLYPFLTAGWGCHIDDFKSFSAYDVLSWITQKTASLKPQEWLEVVGGISVYIDTIVKQLEKTIIMKDNAVKAIMNEQGKYVIIANNDKKTIVDHLVIATNPQQAALLLKEVKSCEDIYNKLLYFESFPATIAVHGDKRFMPQKTSDWSVANIYYDNLQSALTIHKPWKSNKESPLFRSWLINNAMMPDPLYALEHFHHQKVIPRYFQAQSYLKNMLGTNNVWLAGCYMDNLDSHESAIASAMNITEKLMPHSKRLLELKKIIF